MRSCSATWRLPGRSWKRGPWPTARPSLTSPWLTCSKPTSGSTTATRRTPSALALDAALQPLVPALLTVLDVPVEESHWQALDPPQRRQRILDALKRLMLRVSQAQPLLLIVENLHWIDAETQACLDRL